MNGWAGWKTNYVEGGSSCSCRITFESANGTTKKLDYIWATENPPQTGCTRSHDANILPVIIHTPPERVSDHYQYRAYFNC
jgi:hypothetical protein